MANNTMATESMDTNTLVTGGMTFNTIATGGVTINNMTSTGITTSPVITADSDVLRVGGHNVALQRNSLSALPPSLLLQPSSVSSQTEILGSKANDHLSPNIQYIEADVNTDVSNGNSGGASNVASCSDGVLPRQYISYIQQPQVTTVMSDIIKPVLVDSVSQSGQSYLSAATQPNMVESSVPEVVICSTDQPTHDTYQYESVANPDSNPNFEESPDVPLCMVCSDRGSGFHYSVYSCEGCKGFFKRTVQKNLLYVCKESQECTINRFTRNNCQYCRYQKCIQHGMKKEAVREDRTPGGKHKNKRFKYDDGSEVISDTDGGSVFDAQYLRELVEANPSQIPRAAGDIDMSAMTANELMQYGYLELKLIIEWARKVPGFCGLCLEDQMALLKGSFMELNVLRLAYRSLGLDGQIRFGDKIIMSVDQCVQIGWGKELIQATLDFVDRLTDVYIDNTEYCILNAVVLTYPDAPGIKNKGPVGTLQNRILDTLRCYTIQTYPEDRRKYGKLLLRLPVLRTVSAKAAERFLSMTLEGLVKMNALVKEMFG